MTDHFARPRSSTWLLGALLVLLAPIGGGCSGDQGSEEPAAGSLSATTAAQLEGLYEITSHFEDPAGCGAGAAVEDGPAYLVAVAAEFLGIQTLSLVSCRDQTECADFAEAIRGMSIYMGFDFNFTISEQRSPSELSGFLATTGYGDDAGMCTERTYESIILTVDGSGGIAIDDEVMALADRPQDAEGYCVVEPDQSRRDAEGAPCVSHVSVTATRVGDI